jgi:hypothetical protein
MRREERTLISLAEREGVQKAKIVPGQPHARLVGEYGGKPFYMVCTISGAKGSERCQRNMQNNKANIRRVIRKLKEQA